MGLNALLVFVPFAVGLDLVHADPLWVFLTSALAIVPLAGLLGKATEHLTTHVGTGVGGLLNASLGNAAELIIAFVALKEGLHDVVKASLTGSIIGNVLLVLGASMVAGGLRYHQQRFNRTMAGVGSSLLLLAAVGLVIPAISDVTATEQGTAVDHALSLGIAVILFTIYLLNLVFTLKTHKHLFLGEAVDAEEAGEQPWSLRKSVGVLAVVTAAVAVMSEILVGAIEPAALRLGMSKLFVGVILVALVGNAAEHSTAVLVASKNKMDLALGIAIGSSLQIALFVAPVLVFASYAIGKPLDLIFTPFEVAAVTISVLATGFVSMDGESNWLEGALLIGVYLMLAIAFYFLPA